MFNKRRKNYKKVVNLKNFLGIKLVGIFSSKVNNLLWQYFFLPNSAFEEKKVGPELLLNMVPNAMLKEEQKS